MCFGCWSKREKTATACHGCCLRTCAPQTLHAQPTVRVAYAMRHTLNLSLRARALQSGCAAHCGRHMQAHMSLSALAMTHMYPRLPNPTVMPGHLLRWGRWRRCWTASRGSRRPCSTLRSASRRWGTCPGPTASSTRLVRRAVPPLRPHVHNLLVFAFFWGFWCSRWGARPHHVPPVVPGKQPQRRGVRAAQQQFFKVSAPETVPVSAAFGIPHRRRRFFLVASLYGDARDVLLSQARVRSSCACKTAVRMRDPGAMCSKDLAAALLPCCLRVDEAACCAPHAWVEPC